MRWRRAGHKSLHALCDVMCAKRREYFTSAVIDANTALQQLHIHQQHATNEPAVSSASSAIALHVVVSLSVDINENAAAAVGALTPTRPVTA